MAVYRIPTLSGQDVDTHDYEIQISLEAQRWTLRFLYSERQDVWCLSVTPDGSTRPLVLNAPLWLGVNVLGDVLDRRLPGKLIVLPEGPAATESGLRGLGTVCALYYVTADETFVAPVVVEPRRIA